MKPQLCAEIYPEMPLHRSPMLPCISVGRTTSQAAISFIHRTLVIAPLLTKRLGGCCPRPCGCKRLSITAQLLEPLFAEGFLYVGILDSTPFASVNFKAQRKISLGFLFLYEAQDRGIGTNLILHAWRI